MQKFHDLLGCHAIGINSSFNSFLSDLRFSNLICQAKSLIWMIVSGSSATWLVSSRLINIIKIYTTNTRLITRKYSITRIFIKIDHIIICVQSNKKFFNHFTLATTQSGTNFNAARQSSTASSHICWVHIDQKNILLKKDLHK